MAVFQLPTDGIADGAITTAKINASVSLGASVNVILDGTDGGGSNAGDNLILMVQMVLVLMLVIKFNTMMS